MSVLDIGGGNGTYFLWFRSLLPSVTFDWHVMETPKVVAACAPLLPDVTFCSEFPRRPFDIVLASGTIQYLSNPDEILAKSAAAEPWIILTRLPVCDEPNDRFMLQTVPSNLYFGSHAVRIFSKPNLEARLSKLGRLALEWDVDWDRPSLAVVGSQSVGYLIEIKRQPRE